MSELFGGQISVVEHGKAHKYISLPGVVAVETDRSGALWAATLGNEDPPAPGTLVKIIKVGGCRPSPSWTRSTCAGLPIC